MRLLPFSLIVATTLVAGAAAARATDVPVDQANHVFSRTTLSVATGDWLVLTNHDGVTHDLSVTDEDGDPQDLGLQQPGKVMRVHFTNSGDYLIRCSLTPGMRMKVSVR